MVQTDLVFFNLARQSTCDVSFLPSCLQDGSPPPSADSCQWVPTEENRFLLPSF